MLVNAVHLKPDVLYDLFCASRYAKELWYGFAITVFYVCIPTAGAMVPSGLMIVQLRNHTKNMGNSSNKNSFSSHIWAIKMIIFASIYMSATFSSINFGYIFGNLELFGDFKFIIQTVGYGVWMLLQSNCAIKFYLYNLATPHFRKNFFKLILNTKPAVNTAPQSTVTIT